MEDAEGCSVPARPYRNVEQNSRREASGCGGDRKRGPDQGSPNEGQQGGRQAG
jgi:hypothetical protein